MQSTLQHLQHLKENTKGPSRDDAVLVNLRKKCLDMQVRLEELRDHLMQLRDSVGPDRNDSWYTFLQKYDTINKTAVALSEELDRSLTIGHDNFVSVPCALTADPAELPDFLRTKLDPEVERDFDNLNDMYVSQHGGANNSSTGGSGGSTSMNTSSGGGGANINSVVSGRISTVNDVVEMVLDQFDEKRLKLNSEKPSEPAGVIASSSAHRVIAALTAGKGI